MAGSGGGNGLGSEVAGREWRGPAPQGRVPRGFQAVRQEMGTVLSAGRFSGRSTAAGRARKRGPRRFGLRRSVVT